ncbi:MAG: peptidylprolyl isomerase [Chloroflexota bacterium]
MFSDLRRRAGSGKQQPATPPVKKPRISRHERDQRRERLLRIGMAVAFGLVVLVLAGGAINEYLLKPRATLATVNGVSIPRSDYWKARASDLNQQAMQYQQFAQFVGPDQSGQYEQLAAEAIQQIPGIWGSTETDPGTLNRMIEDQLYLQGAGKLGLAVSPSEAENWALAQFAPFDAPLSTPVPTPTYTADRAAMFTATAGADLATRQAESVALGTPAATPQGAPAATPVSSSTGTPLATPDIGAARATAEAGFAEFGDAFFPAAHMSRDDYLRLVAMPNVAREKVRAALDAETGQSAPMVEASHILVETRELADKLEADLAGGADFALLAKDNSVDSGTAANGGDLGWFTRDEMVKPFADAAFSLQPGQTSDPVESDFGWHIIRVSDVSPDRPLTDEQITRIQQARQQRWLEEERAASAITSVAAAAPEAAPGGFVPPPNAPQLPPLEPDAAEPFATPVP